MIIETLESHAIPLADCRAQGYDNAASMSGKNNGAQAIIKEQYSTAIFSPCCNHTLTLCGNDTVECIPELRNYTNNMHFIQLQPQDVGNIGKADWFLVLWHIWH